MKTLIVGRFALAIVCAAVCVWLPIRSLLVDGPFMWHVTQPAAWQGGAEVVVLSLLFTLALGLRRAPLGWLLAALAAEFYARRHGIDLAILAVYLYLEGIFALGRLAQAALERMFPQSTASDDPVVAGMLGVVCWALILWAAAAIGMSSLPGIRLLTVAILGVALAVYRGKRLATIAATALQPRNWLDRAAVGLLAAFCLAMFAKASVAIDYDSMWYGLQADEVLVGGGSLFQSQGLVAVVHHYPKLYESLGLPFSGLGSTSLVFGLGVASWGLLVLTVVEVLRSLGVGRTLRLWGGVLLATLPALANIAITAKGDAFSAWMLMVCILSILRYRNGHGGLWFWVGVTSIALGVLSRLANLPYAALLALMLTWSVIQRQGVGLMHVPGVVLAAGMVALTSAVFARNVLISGLMLIAPDPVVKLQLMAGMQLHEPAGLLPPSEGGRLPLLDGLWGILFQPAQYPHLLITWTANFWLFVPIAVLLLGGRQPFLRGRSGAMLMLLSLGLSFFAMMFGYKFLVPAGDGNYFIVPLMALGLWGLAVAEGMTDGARRCLLVLLLAWLAVAGAAISFVTGSWGPGTRPFDLDIKRLPFELAQRREANVAAARLRGVDRFFTGMSPGTRVVGVEPAGVDTSMPVGWWLPVQYEPIEGFGWQNPSILASSQSFGAYLDQAGIQYLLMPKNVAPGYAPDLVRVAMEQRSADGSASIAYEDDRYVVWKLAPTQGTMTSLDGGGTVRLILDAKTFCAQRANGVATVTWSGSPGPLAIEVKGPGESAKLWAEAGGSGSMTTGAWMPAGGEFIFRRGRGGAILARLRTEPSCD
ncbi:hypothetical protein IB223_03130 [Pseudoxanthomonas sp. PXM03]|uniref:hypothetical protein n=1 Tax=Pseudoxanthomonas sp. PXM03 TaxID=2769284 RepID=UPI00177F0667|nr:hypothetical protein [Pseudoxanthomonas sp. PXM03]MBD9435076.1 hypothetical protein [Pseudoxanthomonas sp. PXM03]